MNGNQSIFHLTRSKKSNGFVVYLFYMTVFGKVKIRYPSLDILLLDWPQMERPIRMLENEDMTNGDETKNASTWPHLLPIIIYLRWRRIHPKINPVLLTLETVMTN